MTKHRYRIEPGTWSTIDTTYYPFSIQAADLFDIVSGRTYIDGARRVIDERTEHVAVSGKGGTHPFKGETAWSAAERLASDLSFAHRYGVTTFVIIPGDPS